jgi:CRP-like cAMP-binding protein
VTTTLDRVALFRSIPVEARQALAERGRLRVFAPGETLVRQGEPSDTMHVILEGRARVERTSQGRMAPLLLAELGTDDVVGEIGVLDGGPRTATVTAVIETRTLELHQTALAVVLIQYPAVAGELLRTLSSRLRDADELAEELSRRGRSDTPQAHG